MPVIEADDGCPLWVEIEGPDQAPVLMLSGSLGTSLSMWDAQASAFARGFRLVRYDRRGHGRSGAPPGPFTMERLAADALAIADHLDLATFHWCGLSLGGMEGMWLAAHKKARVGRLILSNTCCHYADKGIWNAGIALLRASRSLEASADRILSLWFSPQFRSAAPATVARFRSMLTATRVEGYIACCEAIRDMDHRELLARISAPTLIIAGSRDQPTPLVAAEFLHSRIAGADLKILDCAHFSNVEQPDAYARLVLDFLRRPA
jgi:3-oxoadipate enol-lactonase